ncbi:MAG: SDR family oxidoreductase [Bacteroidetes bacterium]|jgi:short-subunit dehydrogenase|nr:SDR family oxidoreductase [Bacteroidota bacterium]
MRVAQKTIAVTGAGNGIGRALALHLLEKGARVACIDKDEDGLHKTEMEAGSLAVRLSCHALDISHNENLSGLVNQILHKHGCIDGLINNAGVIQPFTTVKNIDMRDIERVMNINFYGTVFMLKAFLPHLLPRKEAHIVNVCSMGAFVPVPGQVFYGASKAAVKLLTEGLHSELKNTGIGVSVAFPGAVATEITLHSGVTPPELSQSNIKKYAMISPEKVAEAIVNGMEKDAYHIFIGSDSKWMNTLYRINPEFAANMIQRKMRDLLKY